MTSPPPSPDRWRVCSICKTPIEFGAKHFLCSVSTCRRPRTGLFFCSLGCFEAHLPEARHRDAWAEEELAPTRDEAERNRLAAEPAESGGPEPARANRRVVGQPAPPEKKEVLVVVSKLKKYIKEETGMNTSDGVVGPLSEHLRAISRLAAIEAGAEGRRTVLERDFLAALRKR